MDLVAPVYSSWPVKSTTCKIDHPPLIHPTFSLPRTHTNTQQGLKYVSKDENGGRRITKEGQTALDQIAASVANREDDE